MPAYIKDSSIANPKTRRILEHAIIGALGERDGDWFISIKEGQLSDWQVEIIGPNNFFWKRAFIGVREQDDRGEYVAMTVRDAVH